MYIVYFHVIRYMIKYVKHYYFENYFNMFTVLDLNDGGGEVIAVNEPFVFQGT